MSQVLVMGSVALDTIETPHGKQADILGGSATHAALSAGRLAPVRMVGVVGGDFPKEHLDMLRAQRVDPSGLEVVPGGLTFRWHGRYVGDLGSAETVSVQLNVLGSFQPKVPAPFASTPYVLLGNSSPDAQKSVLGQLRGPRFVLLDTMNLWIETARAGLMELLPRVDGLALNHGEALQLAGARTVAEAIRKILGMGVKTLFVKRGEHGATLATRDFQFSVPTFPTERVVDTTGAGDSFAGGVLGSLARDGAEQPDLRRAAIYGVVMGSLAIEEFGTRRLQNVSADEVEARARSVRELIAG